MTILDFVFPKRCVICKKQGTYLCENCFSYLSFDQEERIYKGKDFDECFCALENNRTSQKLLNSFKNRPYLADLKNTLGELFYESLIQNEGFSKEINNKNYVFSFIPLSKEKLRKRGYNQAEVLANYLAKKFEKEVKNVVDIKNGNVFLVDDSIKTGNTLSHSASLLKKNGAKRVIGLVLVRN